MSSEYDGGFAPAGTNLKVKAARPDFEAAGPGLEAARPDFEAVGPDFWIAQMSDMGGCYDTDGYL